MQINKQKKGGRTGAAVLVYHCDAVVDGVARVPDVDFPAVQVNRTGGNGVETEDRAHDPASACAYQTVTP